MEREFIRLRQRPTKVEVIEDIHIRRMTVLPTTKKKQDQQGMEKRYQNMIKK